MQVGEALQLSRLCLATTVIVTIILNTTQLSIIKYIYSAVSGVLFKSISFRGECDETEVLQC